MIVIILLSLGGLFYFYLSQIFIPVQLKQIIITQAKTALGRQVVFKELSFALFKGFHIKGLTIYQKDEPTLPWIDVNDMTFNVIIPDIITKRQIILSSLRLTDPVVHLTRDKTRAWNFSDLLVPRGTGTTKNQFTFILGRLALDNGKIVIVDETTDPRWEETLDKITASVSLSFSRGVRFDISGHLNTIPGSLTVSGDYQFKVKQLEANITAENIDAVRILSLVDLPLPVSINEGLIKKTAIHMIFAKEISTIKGDLETSAAVTIPGNTAVKGDFNLANFSFNGNAPAGKTFATDGLSVSHLELNGPGRGVLTGDLKAKNIQFAIKPETFSLQGDITIDKSQLLLPGKQTFNGSLALSGLTINRANNSLTLSAAHVQVPDAVGQWGQDKNINMGFDLSDLKLEQTETGYDATAQLDLTNIDATLGKDQRLQGDIKTDNFAFRILPAAVQANASFLLSDGDIHWGDDKTFTGELAVKNASLSWDEKLFSLETSASAKNITTILPGGIQFSGSPQMTLSLHYSFVEKGQPLTYKAGLTLDGTTLKGLPTVDTIQDMKGKLSIENDRASTGKISLTVLETPLTFSGFLKNFADPYLDIQATSEYLSFENLAPVLKDIFATYQINPTGLAAGNITFAGRLRNWQRGQIALNLYPQNVSLTGARLPFPVNQIAGAIEYTNTTLTWKNLSGTCFERTFSLDGYYQLAGEPLLETKLTSEGLLANSRMTIKPDDINIAFLKGNFYNATFSVQGHITPSQGNSPFLNLDGELATNLRELPKFHPDLAKRFADLNLRGDVTLSAHFEGRADKWKESKATALLKSGQLGLGGYFLKDVNMDVSHGQEEMSHLNLRATLDDGPLMVDLLLDPTKDTLPSHLSVDIDGADLAKMSQEAHWPEKDISGKLKAQLKADGPLRQPDKITGKGSFAITDGKIWKTSFLKGVWQVLLIPELENVVFTDASASFSVRGNKLTTRDFILKSKPVALNGAGWIALDKTIDMRISPYVYQLEILKSEGYLQKGLTALISRAENSVTIHLTGVLPNVKYKQEIDPTKVIKKAAENIFDGVQGIIENVIPSQ